MRKPSIHKPSMKAPHEKKEAPPKPPKGAKPGKAPAKGKSPKWGG